MSKRDDLIKLYAEDIKAKFGEAADMTLLTKVVVGLGPAIYNADSSKVSGTDDRELETVKNNYLVKKLGLKDGPELMSAIKTVLDKYGSSNRNKHRAVVYYMLCKHFKKAAVYK
ncbi:MAG: DUF2853 family protein [Flavobacteriales bacterium]|nr:MAG: DUF2853 family protein [Flavobacteriales bacterium]